MGISKRVVLSAPPPADSTYHHEGSPWAAKWVCLSEQGASDVGVTGYRVRFSLPAAAVVRVHVSGDNRYDLFVDGEAAGRGPERGDRGNWFFESYDLELSAGEHVVVARTWWLGELAPYAQMQVRPGFFLHAEGELAKVLDTGVGKWEGKRLGGYTLTPASFPGAFSCAGARTSIDGAAFDWGFEKGGGEGWGAVEAVSNAGLGWLNGEWPDGWHLQPAMLPGMTGDVRHVGVARQVDSLSDAGAPVLGKDHLAEEAKGWDAMLAGKDGARVQIPAKSARRVVVDFGNYYTAYPRLVTSGGRGAKVVVHWAEALYEREGHAWAKGNRDEIEGKVFRGWGDTFVTDGGAGRAFEPLWWEAGRYAQFLITTGEEALTIDSFSLRELHYPHVFESRFESSDPRLGEVVPLALRTLEMCSNETYFDCPYYEQLMYVGDTRLEVLVTYATTRDERLPRKALAMFDRSRVVDGPAPGLTHARYPTRVHQYIPPFSLWWVGMVHDFALWRDDKDFVAALVPGTRSVLDAYRRCIRTSDGLVGPVPGWNFCDWVPGWASGVPPTGANSPVAVLNFQAVYALRRAAELEDFLGEAELARRHRGTADGIAKAAHAAFWDAKRNLYADDLKHEHFSQHAQCLGLLGGSVPEALRERVAGNLFADKGIAQTTIYFTHYLFETARMVGRMEEFFPRMEFWHELKKQGFRTTVEMPEPSRSDCHAWGAHPVYHYYASVLGVRPGSFGFHTVEIRPQLGGLTSASGVMVHPKGVIKVEFAQKQGRVSGSVELPEGISGTLVANGRTVELPCGPSRF